MRTFGQYLAETAPPMGMPDDPNAQLTQAIDALVADLKNQIRQAIPKREVPKTFFQKLGNWWKKLGDPNYENPDSMAYKIQQQRKAGTHLGQPGDLGESLMPAMPIEVYEFFKESSNQMAKLNELYPGDDPSNPNQYVGNYDFAPNTDAYNSAPNGPSTHLGGNQHMDNQTGQTFQTNPVVALGNYLDGPFKQQLQQLVKTYISTKNQSDTQTQYGHMWGGKGGAMTDEEFEDYLNRTYPDTPFGQGQKNLARKKRANKQKVPNIDASSSSSSAQPQPQPQPTVPDELPPPPNFDDDDNDEVIKNLSNKDSIEDLSDDEKSQAISITNKILEKNKLGKINDAQVAHQFLVYYDAIPDSIKTRSDGHLLIKQNLERAKLNHNPLSGGTVSDHVFPSLDDYKRMLREQDAKGYIPPVVKSHVKKLTLKERTEYMRNLMRQQARTKNQ